MNVRMATKCLRFVSRQPGDGLDCRRSVEPKRRVPLAHWRCGNGGTTFSGLTHLVQVGAQALLSASPTANPVGRQEEIGLSLDKLKFKAVLALSAAFVVVAVAAPGSASARCTTGGLTPAAVDICTPTAKARLLPTGELIPPASAPPRVVAVIEAANKIRTKPYIWGGGHGRWWDKGYDCSGSVSFALHGGEFLDKPAALRPDGKVGPPRRRPLDHRLRQRRPRLRGDRRSAAGYFGRRRWRNRPALAHRTARQHRLRRASPGRVLRTEGRRGGGRYPSSLACLLNRLRLSPGGFRARGAKRSEGHRAPSHSAVVIGQPGDARRSGSKRAVRRDRAWLAELARLRSCSSREEAGEALSWRKRARLAIWRDGT